MLCIICSTTLPAFAVRDDNVDSQGYVFTIDDDGNIYYGYEIPLRDDIFPFSLKSSVNLFTDSTFIYELEYMINNGVSTNVNWNDVLDEVLKTGAAAGGATGGATGVAGTIAFASTGQIVLASLLIAVGIVELTQPELLETVVNDIYRYLDYTTQLALDEMYFQETWLIDETIITEINSVISDIVTISDGVVWDKSLLIGYDGLTGYAEQFYSDPPVVQVESLENLNVEFANVTSQEWITMDKNATMLYRCKPEGYWNIEGTQIATSSSSNAGWQTTLEIVNSSTGVSLKYYPADPDGGRYGFSSASSKEWFVGEPILVHSDSMTGMEIVFGNKKVNQSYYEFVGNTFSNIFGSLGYRFPLIMQGTGTVLDGQLITKVTYDSTSSSWTYKYKPPNSGNADSVYKTINLPLEPFHWIYSASHPENVDNSSALDTQDKYEKTDEYGKIEVVQDNKIPQISTDKDVSITKPSTETTTVTDTDTGIETIKETTVITPPSSDSDSNSGGGGISDGGVPQAPANPDNPSSSDFTDFITDFFNFTGLFDWLPEEHSNALDAMVVVVSGFVIALIVIKLVSAIP